MSKKKQQKYLFRLLIFLFYSCLQSPSGYAQYIRHWSESEKLSNRNVKQIIQDHSGFMWLATTNGLNRFDGYNFWWLTKSNYPQLSSNTITCLLEDNEQQLWIGTDNGITILNLEDYQIQRTLRSSESPYSLSDNFIRDIKQGPDKNIWISTADGVLHKYTGKGQLQRIKNPEAIDGSFGSWLHIFTMGSNVWLNTENNGCYQLDASSLKIRAKFGSGMQSHFGFISHNTKYGITVCTKEGVFSYDETNQKLKLVTDLPGNDVFSVFQDFKDNYWVVRDDRRHLEVYGPNDKRDLTEDVFNFADNVHISHITEDRSHNIWVCTTNGIYKLTNEKNIFRSILRKKQFPKPNYIPSFRGMMEDTAGRIFIGGYSGLFEIDKAGHIQQLFDNTIAYSPYLLIDKNAHELWAVTEGFGLIEVNKNTGKIKSYTTATTQGKKYKYQYLTSGILAKDGLFWLGGYEGLVRFNPEEKSYLNVQLQFGEHTFSTYPMRQIYESRNGDTWFCSSKGAFVIDKNKHPKAHYHQDGSGSFRIPGNGVKCIFEDKAGDIWLGTDGGGVVILQNEKIQILNTLNGLTDNTIASITEDNQENIWIATNNGLSRYIKNSGLIVNYNTEYGLSNNEFNHASFLKARNGTMYFGGVNGINICDPGKASQVSEFKPTIVLSKAETPGMNDQMVNNFTRDLISNGISLSYANSNLRFEFFLTDYLRPEQNIYTYLLEGYAQNWIPLGTENKLQLTSLPPGEYTLKIKGAGSKRNWSSNMLQIPITIHQVFYKTWWFFACITIILLGLGLYMFYIRYSKLRDLANLRVKIASDLHDEVGSVLTRVAMQAEILKYETDGEPKSIATSIGESCRTAISSMRDLVWSIDARKSTLGSVFDKMNDYTHQLLGQSNFNYQLHIDENLKEVKLSPIEKQEIYLIFKEALNNAIKHNKGDSITINTLKQKNAVLLSVHNGGESTVLENATGSGIGNMKMRAARIKATLNFDTKNGFTVQLIFPLGNKSKYFS